MGLTEEYFWESEPKKIIALIDQKNKIEKIKNKNLAIYIASFILGNKDPDEMEKKERGLIPGIDIPVDESLVNRLM